MTEGDRERPMLLERRNSDTKRTLTVNPNSRKPQGFNAEFHQRWKGDVGFRREIHIFPEDSVLISELALDSADIVRTVLIAFLKDTRLPRDKRRRAELFRILRREFQRDPPGGSLSRMGEFNSFVRGSNEEMSHFRIRARKMINDAASFGLGVTEEMVYARGLQALSLNEHRRLSILAALSHAPNRYWRKTAQ